MAGINEGRARYEQHQEKVQEYLELHIAARTTFRGLSEAYEEAVEAIINSGALRVGNGDTVQQGWYDFNVDTDKEWSSGRGRTDHGGKGWRTRHSRRTWCPRRRMDSCWHLWHRLDRSGYRRAIGRCGLRGRRQPGLEEDRWLREDWEWQRLLSR